MPTPQKKALLVSMPFGALDRPALGISLLKAILCRRGIPCDVRYLNFEFADVIGPSEYHWLSNDLPYTAFAGDWAFTESLYGKRPEATQAYLNEVLIGTWRTPLQDIQRILRVKALTHRFLQHALRSVPWYEYGIVGFTSTFEQNIASLSMARLLKSRHPDIRTVFGGANWEGEMGLELHRQFPFVDYVCSGESDESFPQLVETLLADDLPAEKEISIPGIVYRRGGESVYTGQAPLVRDMDALPYPDFSDYFENLMRDGESDMAAPLLLLETSRGCWWGAKSHCTFCGLNGGAMGFRRKSDARALREILDLSDLWGVRTIHFADNILDMGYFQGMLPQLAAAGRNLDLFYEVKANLTSEQVRLLAGAGVRHIQPGIESLSDHVLALMKKGVTGLRNVQLLKWCKQYGIEVDWNILYGFPGETRQDYETILRMLPAIRFLQAPTVIGPLRLDRFSPYFDHAAESGLINLRPMASYRHLYPFPVESLSRIAYYFEFDYVPDKDPRGFADELIAHTENWIRNPDSGELRSVQLPNHGLALVDTRSGAAHRTIRLDAEDGAAYAYCDEPRTPPQIVKHLCDEFPDRPFHEDDLVGFLTSLTENRLMVTDGKRYLSMAIPVASIGGDSLRTEAADALAAPLPS
jgi:ribosomal peptide maturation radical SAM protein 1